MLFPSQKPLSHSTGFIHVGKASFGQFRTQLLRMLATPPAHAPTIGVHLLLLFSFRHVLDPRSGSGM